MFFNRKKNQDKPENDDVKSEKSGFFSFFSRSTPTEKAPDPAATIAITEAENTDTEVAVTEITAAEAVATENVVTETTVTEDVAAESAPIAAPTLEATSAATQDASATRAAELAAITRELEAAASAAQATPVPPAIPSPAPDVITPPATSTITSPTSASIGTASAAEIPAPIASTFVAPIPVAPTPAVSTASDERVPVQTDAVAEKPKSLGWFARIKQGLSRTSSQFAEGLGNLLMGKKAIDDELLEELETQLLIADVGIDATTEIINQLTKSVERKQLTDSDALYQALQIKLEDMLIPAEQPLVIDTSKKPFVILVVGVNGVGKTTTIGKLAYQLRQQGKSVMLAAGDTFRAAAVEQLQVWGERNDIHVVAQHTGADSASVIFDAISSAKAKALDVVICDTAGRLHNKNHLMEELAKVRRVIAKLDPSAPHESLLVLDAGTGQNAMSQTENFKTTAGVTGLVLTKLDGTAKGGIIFALSQKFKLPVRFIGVGEGIEDLQTFRAKAFVDALFNRNSSNH